MEKNMRRHRAEELKNMPVEKYSLVDLTDALGIKRSAEILNTSPRAIYTIRHSNVVSPERLSVLIEAVKADHANYLYKLFLQERMRDARREVGTPSAV